MKPYSLDLRERIVAAVEAGRPKSVVARGLQVGRATVDRYVRLRRAGGDLRPKTSPGGPRLIGPDQHAALTAQVEATPDATLAEHSTVWEATQGVRVSRDTMRRAIARRGWRRKKRRWVPANRIQSPEPPGGRRTPG